MRFIDEYEKRRKLLAGCKELLATAEDEIRIILLEQWIHNHNTWLEDNLARYEACHEVRRIIKEGR